MKFCDIYPVRIWRRVFRNSSKPSQNNSESCGVYRPKRYSISVQRAGDARRRSKIHATIRGSAGYLSLEVTGFVAVYSIASLMRLMSVFRKRKSVRQAWSVSAAKTTLNCVRFIWRRRPSLSCTSSLSAEDKLTNTRKVTLDDLEEEGVVARRLLM
eukprot:IDg11170t1